MKKETIVIAQKKKKPDISRLAFWDVDYDKIDREESANFVIPRILDRGLRKEQLELIRFYGKDKIRSIIVKEPYFFKTTFGFLCSYFNLKMEDFTCYTKRQQWHPELWPY